jgi:hypothetical protein
MFAQKANHPHPSPPPEWEGYLSSRRNKTSFPLRGKVGMGVVSPTVILSAVLLVCDALTAVEINGLAG